MTDPAEPETTEPNKTITAKRRKPRLKMLAPRIKELPRDFRPFASDHQAGRQTSPYVQTAVRASWEVVRPPAQRGSSRER